MQRRRQIPILRGVASGDHDDQYRRSEPSPHRTQRALRCGFQLFRLKRGLDELDQFRRVRMNQECRVTWCGILLARPVAVATELASLLFSSVSPLSIDP